jgi:hypothetical protein
VKNRKWVDALAPLGLAAMILGACGPWAAHANAAMSLGALDLVEFVKFMSRAGLTYIVRELFYLPLLAAAVSLSLWSACQLETWGFRLASIGVAALLTLAALPPYPYVLGAYRSPEDRLSFWMSAAAFGLVLLAAGAARHIPRRVAALTLMALALGGAAPAVWQFIRLSGPLSALYGAPVQVGWGLIVTVVGSLLLAASGALGFKSRG